MKRLQHNSNIDQHSVNQVLCDVEALLAARAIKRGNGLDAVVMGGGELSETGVQELTSFANAKNRELLHVAMDQARPFETLAQGNLNFTYFAPGVVTGISFICGGRIWKRDPNSQARLIFNNGNAVELTVKSNGRFRGRLGSGAYDCEGFCFAKQALQKRLVMKRSSPPALSWVGTTPVVFGLKTVLKCLNG